MAQLLKLNKEVFDSSIGALKASTNEAVVEEMTRVATILKNTGDNNPLVEQALEACKKFQTQYNVTLADVDGFIQESRNMYDITEYLEKSATVGEVSNRETGFTNNTIDPNMIIS